MQEKHKDGKVEYQKNAIRQKNRMQRNRKALRTKNKKMRKGL